MLNHIVIVLLEYIDKFLLTITPYSLSITMDVKVYSAYLPLKVGKLKTPLLCIFHHCVFYEERLKKYLVMAIKIHVMCTVYM